jgi:hypothetical protein
MRIITSSKLPTSIFGIGAFSTLSAFSFAWSALCLAFVALASRPDFSLPVALFAWTLTCKIKMKTMKILHATNFLLDYNTFPSDERTSLGNNLQIQGDQGM